MTFGPIVDQIRQTSQCSGRTGPINRVIWHHQAGTNDDATIDVMVYGPKQLSATYTVDNDNYGGRGWSRITGVAPEEKRPWTSNSPTADGQAITIEVCNSSGNPDWGIAGESQEACARIAAYAYQAYGVPLKRASREDPTGHMGHNEVIDIFPGTGGYSTFCPGHLDIDWIIARAIQLLNPTPEDDMFEQGDRNTIVDTNTWVKSVVRQVYAIRDEEGGIYAKGSTGYRHLDMETHLWYLNSGRYAIGSPEQVNNRGRDLEFAVWGPPTNSPPSASAPTAKEIAAEVVNSLTPVIASQLAADSDADASVIATAIVDKFLNGLAPTA